MTPRFLTEAWVMPTQWTGLRDRRAPSTALQYPRVGHRPSQGLSTAPC